MRMRVDRCGYGMRQMWKARVLETFFKRKVRHRLGLSRERIVRENVPHASTIHRGGVQVDPVPHATRRLCLNVLLLALVEAERPLALRRAIAQRGSLTPRVEEGKRPMPGHGGCAVIGWQAALYWHREQGQRSAKIAISGG